MGEDDLTGANNIKAHDAEVTDMHNDLVLTDSTRQLLDKQAALLQVIDENGELIADQEALVNETRPHLTAEERSRAKEAFQLCRKLRHPGDEPVIQALTNNLFTATHLTSQDFRNARAISGPCKACREGKMTAPPDSTSTTEPGRTIGSKIHTDLILLKTKSIGGNTIILTTCEEKSALLHGIALALGLPGFALAEVNILPVVCWRPQ